MLAQRARGEEEAHHHSSPEEQLKSMKAKSISMPSVRNPCAGALNFDVDRPAFGHCAVVRIHSAFGFLENISLWDVTSTDRA